MHRSQTVVIAATLLWLSGMPLPEHVQAEPAAIAARQRATIAKEEAALARETAVVEARRAALGEQKAALARNERERPPQTPRHPSGIEQELADLKAQETTRGLVLTLSDVQFAPDEATLSAAARHKLDALVALLKAQPKRHIRIAGYTDSTGTESTNLDLSQRRADAVRDVLVDNGIHPNRITARGYGEANPIESNATAIGRKDNRRVEILVLRTKQ
jgi:outer membrane protein OmpA-like peptidoglycan-associated protein